MLLGEADLVVTSSESSSGGWRSPQGYCSHSSLQSPGNTNTLLSGRESGGEREGERGE